jgi:hypothetical protein
MAYNTGKPPVLLVSPRDGVQPALWMLTSDDTLTDIKKKGYVANASTIGLQAGDVVIVAAADRKRPPRMAVVYEIADGAGTLKL